MSKNAILKAQSLMRVGRSDDAHRLLRELLNHNPDYLPGWQLMVRVARSREEAVFCLENILRLKPGDPWAVNQLLRLRDEEQVDYVRRPLTPSTSALDAEEESDTGSSGDSPIRIRSYLDLPDDDDGLVGWEEDAPPDVEPHEPEPAEPTVIVVEAPELVAMEAAVEQEPPIAEPEPPPSPPEHHERRSPFPIIIGVIAGMALVAAVLVGIGFSNQPDVPRVMPVSDAHRTVYEAIIERGQTTSSEINGLYDAHNYLLTVEAPDTIVVTVSGVDGANPEVYLYAADGETILGYDDDSAGGQDAQLTGELPIAGTYIIRVRMWEPGSYVLRVESP
ncbi:MAG: hypothetical protein GYB64_02595 [Chloroflexi bacterium]|nr:hypothetical protein [Chloroflexota bacterium]